MQYRSSPLPIFHSNPAPSIHLSHNFVEYSMNQDEITVRTLKIVSRIKYLRLKKNYKQAYMAVKMGCSQNSYSKIEAGRTQLTLKMLLTIAAILEVSIGDLIME